MSQKVTLGEKIKMRRTQLGISREALAAKLGVKRASAVSNWELDLRKPDINKIQELCRALNCPITYFIDPEYDEKEWQTGPHEQFANTLDERPLLEAYRKTDQRGKEIILDIALSQKGKA